MPSAHALQNTFPGAAVAQKGDSVALAGPGKLASHIVTLGGPVGGVVSMLARGTVFLDDWTLATGSRYLMAGKTYFVGTSGRLVTTGGQPVGIALNQKNLSVTIQDQQAAQTPATDLSGVEAQIAALQSQINQIYVTVTGAATSYATIAKYGETG